MKDIIGLIIELLILIIIPTIIPFCITIVVGILRYNEKIKKILMFVMSIIYNGIIGIMSPYLYFCLYLLLDPPSIILWVVCLIIVFTIILLPLNIFMKKKGKINMLIYLFTNIAIFVIGCLIYINMFQGSFDL